MNRFGWFSLCVVLLVPAGAAAQPREPISRFVVDARGTFARLGADPSVAATLNVPAASLPTRGLGLGVDLHWYALRARRMALGLGGEVVLAGDRRTGQGTSATAAPPTVTTRFSSVSPQISLNFGHRDGWSYLSGGIGRGRLTAERADLPMAGEAERAQAINYGGGARWFTGPHVAFSVDVRWYAMSPRPGTALRPGYPRARMMVFSAGISLH